MKEALEDCQAAARRGSGLPLRPSAEQALIDHYRNFFEDQYRAGEPWHPVRGRIMMLSQMVGSLACLLTIFKDFVNKRSAPVAVDAKSAVQAAEIVAFVSKLCWLGGWCPTNVTLAATLETILTEDLEPTSSKGLAKDQRAMIESLSKALGGALGVGPGLGPAPSVERSGE